MIRVKFTPKQRELMRVAVDAMTFQAVYKNTVDAGQRRRALDWAGKLVGAGPLPSVVLTDRNRDKPSGIAHVAMNIITQTLRTTENINSVTSKALRAKLNELCAHFGVDVVSRLGNLVLSAEGRTTA